MTNTERKTNWICQGLQTLTEDLINYLKCENQDFPIILSFYSILSFWLTDVALFQVIVTSEVTFSLFSSIWVFLARKLKCNLTFCNYIFVWLVFAKLAVLNVGWIFIYYSFCVMYFWHFSIVFFRLRSKSVQFCFSLYSYLNVT